MDGGTATRLAYRDAKARRSLSRVLPASALLLGLLSACGADGGSGPPTILYGHDICDRCRMVISEPRHAAAARHDGTEKRFDDPGCLAAYLGAHEPGSTPVAWVHDEDSQWRRLEDAWFVRDPGRSTPMASGVLAFGSLPAASAAAERFGTEVLSWSELTVSGLRF